MDLDVAEEVRQRKVEYMPDMPGRGIEKVHFQRYARVGWDQGKNRWLLYVTDIHTEPEWGHAQAGEQTPYPRPTQELDSEAMCELLKAYKINPDLVKGSDVSSMSPSELEKIADTLKT